MSEKNDAVPESGVAQAIRDLTAALHTEWSMRRLLEQLVTKKDLQEMEDRMAIKVSEIKAAVSAAAKANKEAFSELGTKIADLQKQIDDLIAGNGDPSVTDEQFEADLKDLSASAQALADIVPGSPTPTP